MDAVHLVFNAKAKMYPSSSSEERLARGLEEEVVTVI
jgi:hypothetical protein